MPVEARPVRHRAHQNPTFLGFVSRPPLLLKKFQKGVPNGTPKITKNRAKSSKVLSKVLSRGYLLQALKKHKKIDDFGVP